LALFKKAAAIAALATAGVVVMAGTASASPSYHRNGGDNNTRQSGLIPVYALNNVNVSPNLGCLANRPLQDLNVNDIISLVEIPLNLNHVLEHTNLNVLSNGNISTNVHDDSCTSNQGSSQAGNNSHGSTGAGDSSNVHGDGNGTGSHNQSGNGAGGLLGTTGLLGSGLGLGQGN
jgi:hypothetical protein